MLTYLFRCLLYICIGFKTYIYIMGVLLIVVILTTGIVINLKKGIEEVSDLIFIIFMIWLDCLFISIYIKSVIDGNGFL